MIAVVSPAKSLDFERELAIETTQPRFNEQTSALVETMKTKNQQDLEKLMSISDKLAELNVERFQNFESQKRKAAIYAFQGDVYKGFDVDTLGDEEVDYAQEHLRILSGLYGLLRPLDEIAPYRLEMGTSLTTKKGKSLYDFWGDSLAHTLMEDLEKQGDNILINLASKEYFKSLNRKMLKVEMIDVEFKDLKNGQYKIISFFAKKARGLMARYMAENKITNPEELKDFNYEGYKFDPSQSTENSFLFLRD